MTQGGTFIAAGVPVSSIQRFQRQDKESSNMNAHFLLLVDCVLQTFFPIWMWFKGTYWISRQKLGPPSGENGHRPLIAA